MLRLSVDYKILSHKSHSYKCYSTMQCQNKYCNSLSDNPHTKTHVDEVDALSSSNSNSQVLFGLVSDLKLALAVGVAVSHRSGGRLATMLVTTISVIRECASII